MQSNPSLLVLAIRAHRLNQELARFAKTSQEFRRNVDIDGMRPTPYLVARAHALECALELAEDADALTIANELTDLEMLAQTVLPREAPTVRPPPKSSGTFVIEVRTAATNRIFGPAEAVDDRMLRVGEDQASS